jgi:hypothetical protein
MCANNLALTVPMCGMYPSIPAGMLAVVVGAARHSLWLRYVVILGANVVGWIVLCEVAFARLPKRIPTSCCQDCGYDLTGNVSGVCPECGTSITHIKQTPDEAPPSHPGGHQS